MHPLASSTLALFLAAAPCGALGFQDTSAPDLEAPSKSLAAAEEHLADQISKGSYLGAVAIVVQGDDVLLETALGRMEFEGEDPMAMDAIFRIYSMSKPVTAAAAMVLVEQGKLDLDAPVHRYLPSFKDLKVGVEKQMDGETVLERVALKRHMTVRDLGCHASGLTYGIFDSSPVDRLVLQAGVFGPNTTNESLVEKLSGVPLKHQPGERFEYSLSSDVLGRVIEVASGQPLGTFLEEQIFAPLGMVDTGFSVPKEKLARVTDCYRRSRGELVATRPGEALDPRSPALFQSGGGGLWSTAQDYLLFCRMLLDGGALGDARILKPESVQEIFTDQLKGVPAPMLAFTGGAFGLGLSLHKNAHRRGPHKGTGWWGGYAGTGFWIDREADLVGVFMIQNVGEYMHSKSFERAVYGALGR